MVAQTLISKESKGFTIKNNIIVGDEPKSLETRSIAQILWDSLSKTPDFVAQINADTEEETTFGQIKDRSTRCALWLQKQNVKKDDIIALSTPMQSHDIVPFIATLFVGAIVNPWYHEMTDVATRQFFKTYRPKIMFACEQSIDQLSRIAESEGIACKFVIFGNHPKYLSLKSLLNEQSQEDVENFKYTIPEDPMKQCAIILFSSGTTGTPKGAMLSYNSLNDCNNFYPVNQYKRYLSYTTLSWASGSYLAITSIMTTATRIIPAEFTPDKMSEIIEKYKINLITFCPTMVIQCCKAKVFERYDYSSLEHLCCAGSKLSRHMFEETQRALPHCIVRNVYGMTEMGGLTVRQTPDRKRIESAGFIMPSMKLKIVDTITGNVVGPNQHGEIWLLPKNPFLGYYGNPLATAETLDEDGWIHTGDLGYYDENGELMVIDRIKHLIITFDWHVAPTDVDAILLQHPEVKDCAVVSVPHEVDIEQLFAFVVRFPGAKVTAEELIELPACHDVTYRLKGGVAFVDNLIYTSTGKKNLRLMKEKAKEYVSQR